MSTGIRIDQQPVTTWRNCTPPRDHGNYRPFPGTVCLISGPGEYDRGEFMYHEAQILWCDDTFVLHQSSGCRPVVDRWDNVKCKPVESTPVLVSLPIYWDGGLDWTPAVRDVDKVARPATLGRAVCLGTPSDYRIIGFRTDNEAVIDAETHDGVVWHEDGTAVFAKYAVLKKETDQ
jgi:hypothetical protein